MRHEFATRLLITVADVEEEYSLHVIGEYHRAQKAFTYAGEMAPTDPPEPASFECSELAVTKDGVVVDTVRWVLLSQKQVEAIEDEGLRSALAEDGR